MDDVWLETLQLLPYGLSHDPSQRRDPHRSPMQEGFGTGGCLIGDPAAERTQKPQPVVASGIGGLVDSSNADHENIMGLG